MIKVAVMNESYDMYIANRNRSLIKDLFIKLGLFVNSYFIFHSGLRNKFYSLLGVQLFNGGNGVFIAREVLIDNDFPELVTIDEGAIITWRVVLICHEILNKDRHFLGRIHIKRNAVIGSGSIIMPGVTIGEYAVISPGSVVTTSVPDNVTVAGNPACAI